MENSSPSVIKVTEVVESEPGAASVTVSVDGQTALPLAEKVISSQITGQTSRMEYHGTIKFKVAGQGSASYFTITFEMKTAIKNEKKFHVVSNGQVDSGIPIVEL